MTKWYEPLLLILALLGFIVVPMMLSATHVVHAVSNDYELQMRQVKALEAIAAALCTTPGNAPGQQPSASQCNVYQNPGVAPR